MREFYGTVRRDWRRAAGFFAAIAAAEAGHRVTLLEATSKLLAKVLISGGGRCNVTHSCFDARELVKAYPRGGKALRGPFARFQPSDTVRWFAERGVETKTESDGRMFPVTDSSSTIADCLIRSATESGVEILTDHRVLSVVAGESGCELEIQDQAKIEGDAVLLATGGTKAGFELARQLGHTIVPPVPSLFTFNVNDPRLTDLQGVSATDVECELQVGDSKHRQRGPLLVTHWGVSGPAVLKLSAWAARELHGSKYRAMLRVNWLPTRNREEIRAELRRQRETNAKRTLESSCPWSLPKRLWKSLVDYAVGAPVRWSELPKKSLEKLTEQLARAEFAVAGKGQFKEEFVTCGGVDLDEVDFRTMQSRICPRLFFAGEILDIDAITGGFNFQNAWTTGWIAGHSIDAAEPENGI